jgi:hypothetical protein
LLLPYLLPEFLFDEHFQIGLVICYQYFCHQ